MLLARVAEAQWQSCREVLRDGDGGTGGSLSLDLVALLRAAALDGRFDCLRSGRALLLAANNCAWMRTAGNVWRDQGTARASFSMLRQAAEKTAREEFAMC